MYILGFQIKMNEEKKNRNLPVLGFSQQLIRTQTVPNHWPINSLIIIFFDLCTQKLLHIKFPKRQQIPQPRSLVKMLCFYYNGLVVEEDVKLERSVHGGAVLVFHCCSWFPPGIPPRSCLDRFNSGLSSIFTNPDESLGLTWWLSSVMNEVD